MTYFIYENWQAGPRKAVLHVGECGHCKNGQGRAGGFDPHHARWHGPYSTLDLAVKAQSDLIGCELRRCRCVDAAKSQRAKFSRRSATTAFPVEPFLSNLDAAHAEFYRAGLFGGPSLHFHLRSLELSRSKDLPQFTEIVYALLCSWGMHRMGPKGSKMHEFLTFADSLEQVWLAAIQLQDKSPDQLVGSDWASLESIFKTIRSMKSGTTLVGNSKVMAHLLPNLIAPVDRSYTLQYLFGTTQIRNELDSEWQILRDVHERFFYQIVADALFRKEARAWMEQPAKFPWDTSPLKIADNLIIGMVRGHMKIG